MDVYFLTRKQKINVSTLTEKPSKTYPFFSSLCGWTMYPKLKMYLMAKDFLSPKESAEYQWSRHGPLNTEGKVYSVDLYP